LSPVFASNRSSASCADNSPADSLSRYARDGRVFRPEKHLKARLLGEASAPPRVVVNIEAQPYAGRSTFGEQTGLQVLSGRKTRPSRA